MKNLMIILVIAASIYYYMGQPSKCKTQDDLQQKALEMMDKFQEVATSGDLKKIMSITKRMQDIQLLDQKLDIPATCQAMDDLMAEL